MLLGAPRGDDLPLNTVVGAARRILVPHIPLLNMYPVKDEARLQEVQRLQELTAAAPKSRRVLCDFQQSLRAVSLASDGPVMYVEATLCECSLVWPGHALYACRRCPRQDQTLPSPYRKCKRAVARQRVVSRNKISRCICRVIFAAVVKLSCASLKVIR